MHYTPSRESRNTRIHRILSRFAVINLIFLIFLLLMRAGQYLTLLSKNTLPAGALLQELYGYFQDAVLWLILSWILLIPCFLLSLVRNWLGTALITLVFFLAAVSEWSLFSYFILEYTPLDQVVLSYSIWELILIVKNSVPLNIYSFLPFILITLLTLSAIPLSGKFKIPVPWLILFFVLSFGAMFLKNQVTPAESNYSDRFRYYMRVNKCAYLAGNVSLYLSASKQSATIAQVESAARRYQAAHPEFRFTGTRYPFLHYDQSTDVLSPFFNLGEEKPNFVFIICESLSACFVGNNQLFGSFTPFLDSLSRNGLFWNNCLSTADRTFNVLPAVFGSLPPGDPSFMTGVTKIPYHFSMIRDLHDNGYYTSFFYAGDPSFNYMEDFLERQETDYILRMYTPGDKRPGTKTEDYYWGRPDGELFRKSFGIIDSAKRSPRLDIYLTLSLHAPFIPPDLKHYLSQVDQRLAKIKAGPAMILKPDIEHNKNIFATILYTDHALKEFFEEYRKRPGFANTIFIITGDHGLPELNLHRFSGMSQYNVPLIIYSPMLKKARFMRSVSSHLDITPSILALMREKYGLTTRRIVPWLGSGIDTSVAFRNIHTLPFILNNKEITEYLKKDHFLWKEHLYRLLPECWLKDTVDRELCRNMTNELADFKIINTYVSKQNKLVPAELYFRKGIDSMEMIPFKSKTFNPLYAGREFYSFFEYLLIDRKIKYLKLDISVKLLESGSSPENPPVLVFNLYDRRKNNLIWQPYNIPFHSHTGKWENVHFTEYVEMSYLRSTADDSLVLYIWNRAQQSFRFGNSSIKITGYY